MPLLPGAPTAPPADGAHGQSCPKSGKGHAAALTEANLSGAAGILNEQLERQAYSRKDLEEATMPNGQKYEDWLKDQQRREDGLNSGPS